MDLGLQKFLKDIRYHRERFRQFIGISFVMLVSIAGKPFKILLFVGLLLVILGIAIRLWASGHIKKDKKLAADGPYAYVRHPLYVGNITLGVGFSLASSLWWGLPLLIVILLTFYPQAINKEDKRLHRMFKEEWEQWSKKTRALIPNFNLKGPPSLGSWSFRQSLLQNGEPIIALFLLFWFYILSMGLF